MKTIDQLRRLMAPIRRRIQMLVGLGVTNLIDDSKQFQEAQVTLMRDEIRPGMVRLQNFGFSSHPANKALVLTVFPNGDRSQGIILGLEDPTTRPKDLPAGDSIQYDSRGNRAQFRAEQYELIHATKIFIQASEIEITGPTTINGDVTINGDLTVTGAIQAATVQATAPGGVSDQNGTMQAMRDVYNTHNHGGSSSNPPSATM